MIEDTDMSTTKNSTLWDIMGHNEETHMDKQTRKPYIIRRIDGGISIRDRNNPDMVASYALTPGREEAEIRAWRRALDAHLAQPGATLGNYQW